MRKFSRRGALAGLAALPLSSLSIRSDARSPVFPDPPLRLVVGFPPGSTGDSLARLIAAGVGERLGRAVMVDNKAGGEMAAGFTARAAPDGATFMLASNSPTTLAPALGRTLPYDIRTDFAAACPVGFTPMLLVARPDLQVSNAAELLDLARVHQGSLKGGSAGVGDSTHLALELFKAMAKLDIVHVPYKGSGPAMAALMAGGIDICFADLPAAIPRVRVGKMRGLGQSGLARSAAAPGIATIAESGLPGYEAVVFYGLFLPVGAPSALIEQLNAAVEATLRAPPVAKKLAALGVDPRFGSPAEFAAYVAHDYVKWAYLGKAAGLTAD
ncbi:tripartite tricarboxylate transporter substrate-binding protein [Reyranella sp.]|uniref:tripartite tricarboxylate transporter substrate-binding protein n=1 Tax=Reyranella sp. TaxID=1929291 RepID=UPI0040365A73